MGNRIGIATVVLATLAFVGLMVAPEQLHGNEIDKSNYAVDIAVGLATLNTDLLTMAPGDASYLAVTVANTGKRSLRYAIASTTPEDFLATQIDLTIAADVATCDAAGFTADSEQLFRPGDLGHIQRVNVAGNSAFGHQDGDRTLGAAESEDLCLRIVLPLSTGNAYQGLSTAFTLDFISEQAAGN